MFTIYQAESYVLRIHSCSRKAAGGAGGRAGEGKHGITCVHVLLLARFRNS